MEGRRLFLLAAGTLVAMFVLSFLWEFFVEPILGPLFFDEFRDESVAERWEYIATATVFAGLALVIPSLLLFRAATQRARYVEALSASEERYRKLYDANPAMLVTVDTRGTILSVSACGARQLGYAPEELAGESIAHLHPHDHAEIFADQVARCLETPETSHHFEVPMMRKDGSVLWAKQSARVIGNIGGQTTLLIMSEDITEARRLSKRLRHEAAHDALTGLVNRREFQQRLQRVLDSARESGSEHALCYLDLDNFKVVNDTCGHMAGDELLRRIANLLRHHVRGRDTLARIGGDEFVLLMEHCSLAKAEWVAREAVRAVAHFSFSCGRRSFRLGASIGLVAINDTSGNTDAILRAADGACYTAKEQGGNRVHVRFAEQRSALPRQAARKTEADTTA